MLTKLSKHFNSLLLGLLSCIIISQAQSANATTDAKKLLHDTYMARLEYSSDSLASIKMGNIIDLLEKYHSVVWDKSNHWVLSMNIEMIFDDCPEFQGGKLCNPIQNDEFRHMIRKWAPYIIADFGKSMLGNVWQLKKINGDIILERIKSDVA